MSENSYRPEIDGLRAVAVMSVVFFHAGLGLKGGYVGVDVFFVISGYLITGIVQKQLDSGRFSLIEFWERRVRRIFPALFAMVLATLAVGYNLLLPEELEQLGKSSVAQAILLANVYFWSDTGYFAAPADFKPLLHTWSLAVEEQFYLFYPSLLLLLHSRLPGRLLSALKGMALASFALSVYGSWFHAGATFFLLPTRAWELLVGAILALTPRTPQQKSWRDEVVGMLGLCSIFVSVLLYDSRTRFPGVAAVLPVAGAAGVIYGTSIHRDTLVGKLLSLRPLVLLGLMSYSIYLWHWPVLVYARIAWGQLGWKHTAYALGITAVCSALSWWLVERSFRNKRFLGSQRSLFSTALIFTCVVTAISASYVASSGLPLRFPASLKPLMDDVKWKGNFTIPFGKNLSIKQFARLGISEQESPTDRPDIFLWGDSHGRVMVELFDEAARNLKITGMACVSNGRIPLPDVVCLKGGESFGDQFAANHTIVEFLRKTRPRNLVLIARWSYYLEGDSFIERSADAYEVGEFMSLTSSKAESSGRTCSKEELFEEGIRAVVDICRNNDIQLWIVRQVPETGELTPARDLLLWSIGRKSNLTDRRLPREHYLRQQSSMDAIFAKTDVSSVAFLDPSPLLFDSSGLTINYDSGRAVYRDNDHLTRWGCERLKPFVTNALQQMKSKTLDQVR